MMQEYGQIHCIIRSLVLEKFGKEKWDNIIKVGRFDEDTFFISFKQYPDSETHTFLGVLQKVLGVTKEAALHLFGCYFLTYSMKNGYDKILTTLGADMVSFIENLDSLHSLLEVIYPGISAPSFRCTQEENGVVLHYYSKREGLYPVVIGLLEAVGRQLFQQKVTMTLTNSDLEEMENGTTLHHVVFLVDITDLEGRRSPMWAFGEMDNMTKELQKRLRRPNLKQHDGLMAGTESLIRAEDLSNALPYHILLDLSLNICECGDKIKRLAKVAIDKNYTTPFLKVGSIIQPAIHPTVENIFKFINNIFTISIRRENNEYFYLKGQIMWLPISSLLLFMGSPHIKTLQDMKAMKVFMSDIPPYDVTRQLVLLNQQRLAEIDLARQLDQTSKAVQEEKRRTENLLFEMLPPKIARQLTSGYTVSGERYEETTVLFSDIVTFTDMASRCSADDIVNMLNDMYHRFDCHTDFHDIYKVETIGDAYMAVTGVPEIQRDHAERMAEFAMDMLEEASQIPSPTTGLPLQIRVGMHSGPVIAGVIGKKKPRYDIYGDTVNTASRMESNSLTGRINVSETTFCLLLPYGYKFKDRGEIKTKGKGMMHNFFLVGSMVRTVQEPEDNFADCDVIRDPGAHARRRTGWVSETPTVARINIVPAGVKMDHRVTDSKGTFRTRVRRSLVGYAPQVDTGAMCKVVEKVDARAKAASAARRVSPALSVTMARSQDQLTVWKVFSPDENNSIVTKSVSRIANSMKPKAASRPRALARVPEVELDDHSLHQSVYRTLSEVDEEPVVQVRRHPCGCVIL